MRTTHPYDDDHLREECAIFGIYGSGDAAAHAALGLHALQHRGQEAAGIVSVGNGQFHAHRAMGTEGRDPSAPAFCDACFSGDYPIRLTDLDDGATSRQFSLLAEIA